MSDAPDTPDDDSFAGAVPDPRGLLEPGPGGVDLGGRDPGGRDGLPGEEQ